MSGMTIEADVVSVRPSRLVAEALINGHNLQQVERRAKALGIPREIARVVAAVGCRCSDVNMMASSPRSAGDSPARS